MQEKVECYKAQQTLHLYHYDDEVSIDLRKYMPDGNSNFWIWLCVAAFWMISL